jgi:hypothetical protein
MTFRGLSTVAFLGTLAGMPFAAAGDVALRVESRPMAAPIEASAWVTDGPNAITGLTDDDFSVTLDGTPVDDFTLTLPPAQDPAQKVSLAFAIDHDMAGLSDILSAVAGFIENMPSGDAVSIVAFKTRVPEPDLALVIEPFTLIDSGPNSEHLIDVVTSLYRGGHLDQFAALIKSVEQFTTAAIALPAGPKAIINIGSAAGLASFESQSSVLEAANAEGIPIFTIRVGEIGSYPRNIAIMASFAADSGGAYVPVADASDLPAALDSIASWLHDGYRLEIPQSAVTDCEAHMLEVTVQARTQGAPFLRCDSTPTPFEFSSVDDVAAGSLVVSNTVTPTGFESPIEVSVFDGEYSIGCGSQFAAGTGTLLPGEALCVRHSAAADAGAHTETVLIVGGVAASFISTTGEAVQPPPPDGGGGATGLAELLILQLAALLARRRRIRILAGSRRLAL